MRRPNRPWLPHSFAQQWQRTCPDRRTALRLLDPRPGRRVGACPPDLLRSGRDPAEDGPRRVRQLEQVHGRTCTGAAFHRRVRGQRTGRRRQHRLRPAAQRKTVGGQGYVDSSGLWGRPRRCRMQRGKRRCGEGRDIHGGQPPGGYPYAIRRGDKKASLFDASLMKRRWGVPQRFDRMKCSSSGARQAARLLSPDAGSSWVSRRCPWPCIR